MPSAAVRRRDTGSCLDFRPPFPDRRRVISTLLSAALLDELVSGLRAALGSELVAVYLYGSAVAGTFDPGVSDVDLLVVTARDLDDSAATRLAAFHAGVVERHPDWDDRLELVYVGRDTLGSFRRGGLLGVISPGEPFHVRDGVELWIGNFYLVRETGLRLVGPAPGETIPAVSWGEFLGEVARYADEVRRRDLAAAGPAARAYNVLTMCRALATIESDRPRSKQEGAAFVRSRMPEWAWLIDEAERCRLTRGRSGFADEQTVNAAQAFVESVAAGIDSAVRRRLPSR